MVGLFLFVLNISGQGEGVLSADLEKQICVWILFLNTVWRSVYKPDTEQRPHFQHVARARYALRVARLCESTVNRSGTLYLPPY